MIEITRIKALLAALVIALVGVTAVGCGDDNNDGDSIGDQIEQSANDVGDAANDAADDASDAADDAGDKIDDAANDASDAADDAGNKIDDAADDAGQELQGDDKGKSKDGTN